MDRKWRKEFGHDDDNDARSIRTILPHELEQVRGRHEDPLAKQEQEDEGEDNRRHKVELGDRTGTPQPTGM